jgi:hypothetical protein
MDDGTLQRITRDSAAFEVGDRVQVTAEGRVVKIAIATTPGPAVATPAPAVTAPPAVATPAPAVAAPPTAASPAPPKYRAGVGVIESASVVSLPSTSSAAAGATSAPTMAYRLRMSDGTTQSVLQAGERFQVGDRVQLTGEGRLIRP